MVIVAAYASMIIEWTATGLFCFTVAGLFIVFWRLSKRSVFVNLKLCHFQWKFQLKIVPVFYYASSVIVTQKEVERR